MTSEVKLNNKSGRNAAPKKRKIASLNKRKARAGWIFVLPFVLGFVCIYLPIIIESIKSTFMFTENVRTDPVFVGFDNYVEALTAHAFLETLLPGIGELVFDIPAILLFSLFMAILLNQKMMGRAAFRAIFFLPVVLATGIMTPPADSSIDAGGFDNGSGSSTASEIVSVMDIQKLFANMKIGTELVDYVVELINDIYDIVNRSGVQILIFLAGLQSISPAIYESVQIDGASSWETFWKITFPMISPMILVNAVYTVIDSFTTESNPVMKYVMDTYTSGKMVESSAMAWMYFLIVILVIAVVAGIFSAFVFYQRKD